jgi:predicted ATPase
VAFGVDNSFEMKPGAGQGKFDVPFVRIVDSGLPVPLHQTFTHIARTGRRDDVYELLSALVPDFGQLEILVEDDDSPSLYLTSAGRSVPVGLAGDGVQAFVQLALEIAVAPEGLVLVEEPEVYQHPKAIWQTAKVLLANMRRGVQMVITTHSLELIDAILSEASEDDLGNIALFNLKLVDGELEHGRRVGEEIAFARQTLENDLR